MRRMNRAAVRSRSYLLGAVFLSLGLSACSGDDASSSKRKALDGIYAGTLNLETADSEEPSSFNDVITLVGNGRAIIFTTNGLASSNATQLGGDIKTKLKPGYTDGTITSLSATAKGTQFANSRVDGTINMTSLTVSGFTAYPHLPLAASDKHPDGFAATYNHSKDGVNYAGSYSPTFVADKYTQPANLAFLANLYETSSGAGNICGGNGEAIDSYVDGNGNSYLICPNGNFKVITASDCHITGSFSVIDANHNLYEVTQKIAEDSSKACEDYAVATGNFTGLAFANLQNSEATPRLATSIVVSMTSGSTAPDSRQYTYQLFRLGDDDGDGVFNHLDQCPTTPAGVIVDQYGCPTDNDGDGVPDYLDKCPNTPSGIAVGPDGCSIDSDNDGVPDYLDKCPGTPAGVAVGPDGCPVDSDGDGIPDYLDACPNTPPGLKVLPNGCAIQE